jgi:hypothetical protein
LDGAKRWNFTFGGWAHWACPAKPVWNLQTKPSTLTTLRQLVINSELAGAEAQHLLGRLIEMVVAQSSRMSGNAATAPAHQPRSIEKPFEADVVVAEVAPTPSVLSEQATCVRAVAIEAAADDRKDETPDFPGPTPLPVVPPVPVFKFGDNTPITGRTPFIRKQQQTRKRKPPAKTTPSPHPQRHKPCEPTPISAPPTKKTEPITFARVQLAAQMANAQAESDSEDEPLPEDELPGDEYGTSDEWIEPDRNEKTRDFLDRAYELKVREQQHAIRKAYFRVITEDLVSMNKAQRKKAMQDFIEEGGGNEVYDKCVREMAETQVRKQGKPIHAYYLVVAAVMEGGGLQPRGRASASGSRRASTVDNND